MPCPISSSTHFAILPVASLFWMTSSRGKDITTVLTSKFGKLTLERKRSVDDVKNKIIEDICLLTSVFEARLVPIAD